MSKKLTKEELEKFVSANKAMRELRERLADITITEEHMKTDKQATLINIGTAREELAEVNKEISEKYGQVRVNMKTGELS